MTSLTIHGLLSPLAIITKGLTSSAGSDTWKQRRRWIVVNKDLDNKKSFVKVNKE